MTTPATTNGPVLTHRPYGSEHPYATSADQRVPVLPVAGGSVRLGVIARGDVTAVTCEWHAHGETTTLPMRTATVSALDSAALAGGDGHLAEAQAAALTADGGWFAQSPPLEEGTAYRYRFVAQGDVGPDRATGWFDVSAAVWSDQGGDLTLTWGERLVPGSVQWLRDADGVQRVRFALRLAQGEHVVGFGERFDAVDQRGRSLDAVVFEQYKSQGRYGRTYLPMPFAHVIGESTPGWGLHVRTSRRTWFDVGASRADQLVIEAALGGAGHEHLDVALYDGAPHEVLGAFTAEVGRAEELPDWVFRLWASGNEWNTQATVLERMNAHRDLEIPVGAVVISTCALRTCIEPGHLGLSTPGRYASVRDALGRYVPRPINASRISVRAVLFRATAFRAFSVSLFQAAGFA